jgi:hypothetical protein
MLIPHTSYTYLSSTFTIKFLRAQKHTENTYFEGLYITSMFLRQDYSDTTSACAYLEE